jgi:hypothetical protein
MSASRRDELRAEVEAAVEARRELGAEMEPEVIDAFLDRIESQLAERGRPDTPAKTRQRQEFEFALAALSVIFGVGLAVAAMATGPDVAWVAAVSWIALYLINRAYRRSA